MKVQYPGSADAIRADLANADLLGSMMSAALPRARPGADGGRDPGPDRRGAGLPRSRRPTSRPSPTSTTAIRSSTSLPCIAPLSTGRVLTTELAAGAPDGTSCSRGSQAEKDLAAEAIFRFVFRSLYRFHAFNGDPHPGNYLFRPGGQVTFLDFGLVKHFDDAAMATFQSMIGYAVLEPDHARFRAAVEGRRAAPARRAGEHRGGRPLLRALLRGRAGRPDHHLDDRRTPRPPCARRSTATRRSRSTRPCPRTSSSSSASTSGCTPSSASCGATANYRKVAEELWPMVGWPALDADGRGRGGVVGRAGRRRLRHREARPRPRSCRPRHRPSRPPKWRPLVRTADSETDRPVSHYVARSPDGP